MNITKLRLTPAVLGNQLLLVAVKPEYEYQNGVRTNKIIGYKYEVVASELGFEHVTVKIAGEQQMDTPDGGYTEVNFEGLQVFLYWRQGSYDLGCTATKIRSAVPKRAPGDGKG